MVASPLDSESHRLALVSAYPRKPYLLLLECKMKSTLPLLEITDFPELRRQALKILQVNLGYRCNQTCVHCHVNAGPTRKEMMHSDVLDLIPDVLTARGLKILDLTGGAPELHEGFRRLVETATQLEVKVIDRCNLTILSEPGHEDLAQFLARHRVEVTASMPCYLAENVDRQRGKGVFNRSIDALQKLNELGYGYPDTGLVLNLVYNPSGPNLPPDQKMLEADYKRELWERFGIRFNSLFTLTNMPIQRFGSTLVSQGLFADYMQLLKKNCRPENLSGVMCLDTVSVDWQGYLYDCDFNQQLKLPVIGKRLHLRDLLLEDIDGKPIRVADHCYGCTAGQGSSCGGALN